MTSVNLWEAFFLVSFAEAYSESSLISKMELFTKIVHRFQSFTFLLKALILDVLLGSECAFDLVRKAFMVNYVQFALKYKNSVGKIWSGWKFRHLTVWR